MRLLVVRLSALGDVIHTMPAAAMLRDTAQVSWVVEQPYAEMVSMVARVQAIPVRLKRFSPSNITAAAREVRPFDLAVDFQGLLKSALVARASGASLRFGFDRLSVREKAAAWFYNRPVAVDRSRHVVEWNRELAAAVLQDHGVKPPALDWSSFPHDPSGALAGYRHRVVIVPGAGKAAKQWPAERFRHIASRFNALVLWGPGERTLAEQAGPELAPPTSLRELAYVLQRARLVVGADTGPLHLAAALGTAVVGLYGPTDPIRNGPYGQIASTIDHYRSTGSMSSISTDEVVRKIEEVLG